MLSLSRLTIPRKALQTGSKRLAFGMSSRSKHNIVALDGWVKPPAFSFDYEITQYPNTSADELPERMKDATIVITSATPVSRGRY